MDGKKDCKLVKMYCYVIEKYGDLLQYLFQRFSNNIGTKLTNQEIMIIYSFAIHHQSIFKIKQIYRFATDYRAFNNRLNRISHIMNSLVGSIRSDFVLEDISDGADVPDSMPIITCSGKGKVAREITDKGYRAPREYTITG